MIFYCCNSCSSHCLPVLESDLSNNIFMSSKCIYGIPSQTYFITLQKWSKGKVRDKLNNQVLFDKPTYEKLYKEVPQYKLITPAVVSERLKVRGSLARRALIELREKGILFFNNFLSFE